MFKKTLITLGLLAVTTLSGCVVVAPRHHYYREDSYSYYREPGPVVISPFFGFYGGYGYHGYYRGGYGGGYHRGR